ncbi:MAG: DoxX family protein [Candidatus Nealsonbacteria bacterium]|nr:DoxX family protein [Candidatus Nealsonbacteria bacterium]
MIFPQLIQYSDFGIFLLRLAVGLIFLIHGTQKLAMWKMKPSPEMPSKMINIMRALSVVEPVSSLVLISGIFTQLAAGALALVMVGAIYFKAVVWKKKFSEPGGWEFDFILLAANLAIILNG